MDREELRKKLDERIEKHSHMDLLHILDNTAMKEEYSFLIQHRTAVALEDIVTELHELNGYMREWKEEACKELPWQ